MKTSDGFVTCYQLLMMRPSMVEMTHCVGVCALVVTFVMACSINYFAKPSQGNDRLAGRQGRQAMLAGRQATRLVGS